MKITDIYKKYRINKGLQEHMIRVASVAKVIGDSISADIDVDSLVSACLVHDMGNLIKSNMDSFPEFFEPEGVAYWKKVKEEMIAQYGTDEHVATQTMVAEIGLLGTAQCYFLAIGNESTERVEKNGDLGEKIATYSDMRVGPYGVISLQERMDDIRWRYIDRNMKGFGTTDIDNRERFLKNIEREIFITSTLTPENITDATTTVVQSSLWDWEIATKS